MQVFINESSLHSQYYTIDQFKDAIKEFINCLDVLKEQNASQTSRSDNLYLMSGIHKTNLSDILRQNTDLSLRFKDSIQKNNVKSWENAKIHKEGVTYVYKDVDYNGYSIAEFAERKTQDRSIKGFLLNFVGSPIFSENQIDVIKESSQSILLDCNSNATSISNWFIEVGLIDPNTIYNPKSKLPPTDEQTVLIDKSKFERTSFPKNNGRTVYRLIGTDQLWVVDGATKHATDKAHIEIFHEVTRKHLGTSLYNEINLNEKYKVKDRQINLE